MIASRSSLINAQWVRLAVFGDRQRLGWCHGTSSGRGPARRRLISAVAFTEVLVASLLVGCGPARPGAELEPTDPIDGIVEATAAYPVVGLAEPHLSEDFHSFVADLLPELPGRVDDIVVEFGNARYQGLADRFILELEPVAFEELAQIWRTTIGGRVYWDAPVYEQFFRSVQALNRRLQPEQRIRVLLGDPPIDWSHITSAADRDEIPTGDERETFCADLVDREVLTKGHRALLIMGGDHLRRGEYTGPGGLSPSRNPRQPNVATLLTDAYPGSVYIILTLAGPMTSLPDPSKLDEAFGDSPRPSLATVAGTWLADEPAPYRLLDDTQPEFGRQVDAVLWLGPEDELTESLPDATLYQAGPYANELRRRSEILTEIYGQQVDLVGEGLLLAAGGRRALAEANNEDASDR